jgi:hypothetical protein
MIVFSVLWSTLLWAEDPVKPIENSAELKVANRSIMVFRATLLGEAPASRVKRAKAVISESLDESDDLTVSVDPIQNSYMVLLGARRAFIVSPKDVDDVEYESVQQAAEDAAAKLRLVVSETAEARNLHLILRSLTAAAIATGIYAVLLWGVAYLRRRLLLRLPELMDRHTRALKVGRVQVLEANYLYPLVVRLLWLLRWLVLLLLTYEWLGLSCRDSPTPGLGGKASIITCSRSPAICFRRSLAPYRDWVWRWRFSSSPVARRRSAAVCSSAWRRRAPSAG